MVTFLSYVVYATACSIIHALHHVIFSSASGGFTPRQVFGHPPVMMVPFSLLNPFFEELVVRAYLMTEVKDLSGSWILSAALSVAIQTSYHLYYGWEGALALSFQFLALSIYYARTRRITPIIIAHGFFDIYGLVRLW